MTEPTEKKRRGRPPIDPNSSKECPRCKRSFPRPAFGGRGYCTECYAEYHAVRYQSAQVAKANLPPDRAAEEEIFNYFDGMAKLAKAKTALAGLVGRPLRCACCYEWTDQLAESESGAMLCDVCGYYAARCGMCPEHMTGIVYCPSAKGGVVPSLPEELRPNTKIEPLRVPDAASFVAENDG